MAAPGRPDLLSAASGHVPQTCTVLIGAAVLLPSLKARAGAIGDVLTFTDSEALRALEEITRRRPDLVILEQLFAASPRGLALVNRIKADPTLSASEVRVLSHTGEPPLVATDATSATAATTAPSEAAVAVEMAAAAAPAFTPRPLDPHGTRRAPRHVMAADVEATIDGNIVTVIDLSTYGATVVSAAILKPNQRVRLALSDGQGAVRINAAVAWASFEIPPGSAPRYRAGLEFVGPDAAAIDAYCTRHKARD